MESEEKKHTLGTKNIRIESSHLGTASTKGEARLSLTGLDYSNSPHHNVNNRMDAMRLQ